MNDLALHIEYLLLRHDCVIVPGMGAFLAHNSGAVVDESTGMLMPPARTLGYNSELTHNDGLLIESVARREHKTFEAARAQVDKAVSAFMFQLKEETTLPIGNLGSLTADAETGSLVFTPADVKTSLINLPSCGLQPVRLRPLEEEPELVVDAAATETHTRRRRIRKDRVAWVAASMMALLLVIGMAFIRPDSNSNERHEYASIDSGLRSNVGNALASEAEKTLEISREILLNIARPVVLEGVQKVHMQAMVADRYLLVVGSFPSEKAAKAFINGNNTLSYQEMDGKYRVFAATASNINDAHKMSASLSETYPNVWICRR
ncbi:MAG: hypothetical protein NC339_04810 [Muribaculaceae bacterium]|nr:hypothetical protein [Muribaculaceae bacterium]